jgi:hypothetical protein
MIDISDDDRERIEASIRDRAFKDGGFATAYAILALTDELALVAAALGALQEIMMAQAIERKE